jgi:hypothetical protein
MRRKIRFVVALVMVFFSYSLRIMFLAGSSERPASSSESGHIGYGPTTSMLRPNQEDD